MSRPRRRHPPTGPPLVCLGQGDFTVDVYPEDLTTNHDGDHEPMALMQQIKRGQDHPPRRVLLYGTAGIGKTTFGAMSRGPIFIQTEDGLAQFEVDRFPKARSLDDVEQALAELAEFDHQYGTVVVDSLDWLERLVWARVCGDEGVEHIEKVGYQKGYAYAVGHWRRVLGLLDTLRFDRGMAVILLAHAKMERVESPVVESYDRYAPRLHKLAANILCEWVDEIFFATYVVKTREVTDPAKKTTRLVGVGGLDERLMHTVETPAHIAKNRLNLPERLPLDWRVYDAFVRGDQAAAEALVEQWKQHNTFPETPQEQPATNG